MCGDSEMQTLPTRSCVVLKKANCHSPLPVNSNSSRDGGRAGWGLEPALSVCCISPFAEKQGQVPEVPFHSSQGPTVCVLGLGGALPLDPLEALSPPTASPPPNKIHLQSQSHLTSSATWLHELMSPKVVQRIQAPPFPLSRFKVTEGPLRATSSLLAGDTKPSPTKPQRDSTQHPAWTGEFCPGSELPGPKATCIGGQRRPWREGRVPAFPGGNWQRHPSQSDSEELRASHLTPLSLCVPLCRMEIITVPTS